MLKPKKRNKTARLIEDIMQAGGEAYPTLMNEMALSCIKLNGVHFN
jgi:hypothetical protein